MRWLILRLFLALAIALAGGAGAACVAWFAVPKRYTATAIIDVAPRLEPVGSSNTYSAESIHDRAAADAEMLQSPDGIRAAMNEPVWRAVGPPPSPQAIAEFSESLRVSHRGSMIKITFSGRNPSIPPAAVCSLVGTRGNAQADDMKSLLALRESIASLLRECRTRLDPIIRRYGSENLERLHLSKTQELEKAQAALQEAQSREGAPSTRADLTDPHQQPLPSRDQFAKRVEYLEGELREIARAAVELRTLHQEEDDLRRRMNSVSLRLEEASLNLYTGQGNRVLASGTCVPAVPNTPQRIRAMATAGASTFALLFLIVLLRSLKSRRRAQFLK